jgi:hypothetical protein
MLARKGLPVHSMVLNAEFGSVWRMMRRRMDGKRFEGCTARPWEHENGEDLPVPAGGYNGFWAFGMSKIE